MLRLDLRRSKSGVLLSAVTGIAVFVATMNPAGATTQLDLRTQISNTSTSGTVSLSAGTWVFKDFISNDGADFGSRNVTGAGSAKTILKMNTGSSTQAGNVPTASGTTNQLYELKFAGSPTIKGLTLTATDQGHLYNGVMMYKTTNAKVSDFDVNAVPGDNHEPPGETFGINDYKGSNDVYDNVNVNGNSVGASGFGSNGSNNVTLENSSFTYSKYAMGVTFWKTTGNMTMTNVDLTKNRTALNYEQDSGTSTITNVKFGNRSDSSGHDINMGSNLGSVKLTIVNPTLPSSGKLVINCPSTYLGASNTQKRSDIKVMINGVDKTSSVVQFSS